MLFGALDSAAVEGQVEFIGEGFDLIAVKSLLHDLCDVGVFADTDDSVDLAELLHDLAVVTLGKTARDDDRFDLAFLFQLGKLQDLVDAFLLGALDETAGVDDDSVCHRGVFFELKTRLIQLKHHQLGVHAVFRAAERYDTYTWHISIPLSLYILPSRF